MVPEFITWSLQHHKTVIAWLSENQLSISHDAPPGLEPQTELSQHTVLNVPPL